jgi:hypothetical protein
MKKIILPACALAMIACAPQQKENDKPVPATEIAAQPAEPVFPWLQGKWMIDYGDAKVYESWAQQSSTLLQGEGYVISGTDTIIKETMRIEKIGGTWVFIAKINDHAPVLFASSQNEQDRTLVFKNPEHDYPQQITYGAGQQNGLFAVVEGREKGKDKKEEYNYTRY